MLHFWYQSVVFVELHCVALYLGTPFSPCCDSLSAMVSFGSVRLEQTQSCEIPDPEPLPKSVFDAIFQAIVMGMEKQAHFYLFLFFTHPSHMFERGKNTLLHDIHKSVQPPIFSGGANIKPEAILSFLRMVEKLFKGELSDKDKVRAVSFLLTGWAHFWWTHVKTDREEVNKNPVQTWFKFKKLFLEHFLPCDHIQSMKECLKGLRQGTLSIRKYEDRFDELVEYFPDLSDNDIQIFFVTDFETQSNMMSKLWSLIHLEKHIVWP